jgi:phosphotransferase family enzyme
VKKYQRRHGDSFVKFHGPAVEEDWKRVNALAEMTQDIAGVRTAKPLHLDTAAQCITYEWLGDLPGLITLPDDQLRTAVSVMGEGLARIHEQGMRCPSLQSSSAEPPFPLENFGIDEQTSRSIDARLPRGFFHGDCWHGNILVDEAGACVLIDPIQVPWLFGQQQWIQANGIVDLATLHMSLFMSYRIWPLINLDIDQQIKIGELLLESYLQHFSAQSLRPQVLRLSRAIAIQYVSSYPTRINFIVGKVKQRLSKKLIATIDAKLAW